MEHLLACGEPLIIQFAAFLAPPLAEMKHSITRTATEFIAVWPGAHIIHHSAATNIAGDWGFEM
jgi:hypothetical protein